MKINNCLFKRSVKREWANGEIIITKYTCDVYNNLNSTGHNYDWLSESFALYSNGMTSTMEERKST